MRVIAGSARGRRLRAPAGRLTRPTSDRVREAIMSMLVSLDALADAEVADLFAGSGALGIEALSRGARHATFVEMDRDAVAVIKANLDATDLRDRATVIRGDASAFTTPVGVAFVDPPYDFSGWIELLKRLEAGVAVLESGEELVLGDRWTADRVRRYGSTVVTLARQKGGA